MNKPPRRQERQGGEGAGEKGGTRPRPRPRPRPRDSRYCRDCRYCRYCRYCRCCLTCRTSQTCPTRLTPEPGYAGHPAETAGSRCLRTFTGATLALNDSRRQSRLERDCGDGGTRRGWSTESRESNESSESNHSNTSIQSNPSILSKSLAPRSITAASGTASPHPSAAAPYARAAAILSCGSPVTPHSGVTGTARPTLRLAVPRAGAGAAGGVVRYRRGQESSSRQ